MYFTGRYRCGVDCFRWLLAGAIFISVVSVTGAASRVTLAWDATTESNVAGFKVYAGTNSGVYTSFADAGAQTTLTISNLVAGVTYYFAATAYNTAGLESDFSEEISHTVGVGAPEPARLVITDRRDGSFLIQVSGSAGGNYTIEYADDLNPGAWQSLGAAMADASGLLAVTNIPPDGSRRRFYRAVGP